MRLIMDPNPDSDPDPAVFVIDFQDAKKKKILNKISAYYFLKVRYHTFTSFFKDKKS
jgi:hypothetical protein